MAAQQEHKFKVIGTRPIRHDGVDKVTGRAQYGADISLAGLLHGKVLCSPHAHARIKSIDTSAAEALPGVKAVVTAKDFPEIGPRYGGNGRTADQPAAYIPKLHGPRQGPVRRTCGGRRRSHQPAYR